MLLDSGLCIEFSVTTATETFPLIYRPSNLEQLIEYLQPKLITEIYEEYKAIACELTHIYVKGDGPDVNVEFYIGNEAVPMEMCLFKRSESDGVER